MSRAKFHSSAAEYLTYVAFVGAQADSFEIRYEDENIWLTQKMMAALYNEPASTKFWTIEKRMKQDKKTPGVCIELNKGNIIFDLVCFFQDEVITFDDFSEELRENVKLLLERFGKYE